MNYAMLLARSRLAVATGGGGGVEPPISGEGWDISTAVFSQSFSVASQDTIPNDVFFKPDGLKVYAVGTAGDAVSEYNLSTAWDISTATYLQNFSVASRENDPNGLFFSPDGLKMYVVGYIGDAVHEYNLSTAWDISTATYFQNFSVAPQESFPTGLFFKPDGLKMYMVGLVSGAVNEYDLSTAWDISTATYLQNFSVAPQESGPNGLFFKPDGLKMYVVKNVTDTVSEYNLSAAWDISTATYLQNFSVAPQESGPRGLFFKPDGLKMYVVGFIGDAILEYSLSPV